MRPTSTAPASGREAAAAAEGQGAHVASRLLGVLSRSLIRELADSALKASSL